MTSPFGIPGLDNVEVLSDDPPVRQYRGHLDGHDKPVRIEVISDDAACSRGLADGHPGLLEPLAVGETDDGGCAVVWPEGESLADRLRHYGAMPWHRAAQLVIAVAEATEHVHQLGLFHGGIDTAAVQFGPDHQPRLGGFGLARLRAEADGLLAVDPAFTAPEIGTTGSASCAGDVYSLGALLAATLDGGEPTDDLKALCLDTPSPVIEVVARATAPDPAVRFESVAAFTAGLRSARDWALYSDDEASPPPQVDLADSSSDTDESSDGADDQAAATIPPLDDDDWYASDRNLDWEQSVSAVMANEVIATPLDDTEVELLPGLDDADGRVVITLADAERGAHKVPSDPARSWEDMTELIPVMARPETPAPGTTITIADAEQAVVTAEPAFTAPPTPADPPVLTVETGRVEVDEPVEGDVLVTGGQLVIKAEVRGSVTVDGGRAVVFAPVTGDVINGGGTVSVEAKVSGRIRGQREFTTVRPGSQA